MQQGSSRSTESLFNTAQQMAEEGDRDLHIAELLSAYLKQRPDHGFAWYLYGDALRSVGRLKEAETALTNALDLAPKSSRFAVYARMGMVARRSKGPKEAERWYRMATAEPDCPGWMWLTRGANLVDVESFRQAAACLETALTSNDVDREEAWLNLALIARAQGHFEQARNCLRKAIEIDPDYADAKRILSSLEGIEDTLAIVGRSSSQAK